MLTELGTVQYCLYHHRSFSIVSVPPLKTPWKKRQVERAEKKALQEYVNKLKTARQQEKEVPLLLLLFIVLKTKTVFRKR